MPGNSSQQESDSPSPRPSNSPLGGGEVPATVHAKATCESIVSVHWWSDTLFTFRTTRPEAFLFAPGQYARLGLQDGAGMLWRAYSVTSAPSESELEFYGIVVPGGAFTTRLRSMQPGMSLWIEKTPYGFMTVDRFADGQALWMLATGTGLGPYLSILRDPAVWDRFADLVLVHGVRHARELAYQDVIAALQQMPPTGARNPGRLQTIACTTREDPPETEAAGRLHGRITALIESGALEARAGLPLTPETARVMLCGNPEMIEETRKLLHGRGMKPCRRLNPGQFVTENYW